MTAILGRDRWGAAPPAWNPGSVNPSLGMFIHYNGPPVNNAVLAGDFESVASFLRAIQRYHMQKNGWPDIAYSFCVDSMGRIWTLRGWGVAGAHTMDWNWKSHAIFLPLGGNQAPTEAQIAACRTLINDHNRRYGTGFVRGHLQAPNSTSCPGPVVMARINAGDFNPALSPSQPAPPPRPTPAPTVPAPPGVDTTVNEPVLIKIGPKIWIFYRGTPWRVHVRTPADVQAFRFMGVPYQEMNEAQGAFFLRYSHEVKTG